MPTVFVLVCACTGAVLARRVRYVRNRRVQDEPIEEQVSLHRMSSGAQPR